MTKPLVLALAPGKLLMSGTLNVTYVMSSAEPLVRPTVASLLGWKTVSGCDCSTVMKMNGLTNPNCVRLGWPGMMLMFSIVRESFDGRRQRMTPRFYRSDTLSHDSNFQPCLRCIGYSVNTPRCLIKVEP